MRPPPVDDRPGPLRRVDGDERELGWLLGAQAAGVPVAPMAVVPARTEDDFYRWNALPARIVDLFADLDPADPDEDDVEDLLPTAIAWVGGHALLDAVVDAFYDALTGLPARVTVRRPGEAGLVALRGRPALLALKRVWADAWRRDAVLHAARTGGGWRPPARPVLVHAADMRADEELARAAGAALGRRVHAWCDDEGRLVRLALP